MNTRIMLDLETLSTQPGGVILSIGAVKFAAHGLTGGTFYQVISIKSCTDAGLTMDPDTLEWWLKQSQEARDGFLNADKVSLNTALMDFRIWALEGDPNPKNVEVWGNGANFDNALLTAAYRAVHNTPPWMFYNDRCYRTVKALHPDMPLAKHTGTKHNALDDAVSQALHLITLPSFQAMCKLEAGAP